MEWQKDIFSNRMKRQTAVCCMSGNWRQTGSREMQFYASFAHNLERDEPRHPSNVSALDIKSSAFSTPEEEEEEERCCGKKRVSYGSVYISYCTCAAQWSGAGTEQSRCRTELRSTTHTDCWCQLEQPVKCECSIFSIKRSKALSAKDQPKLRRK